MNYAFVSGGSDRIGKAIAIKLSELGYNIILHYNSAREKAEITRKLITSEYKRDCVTIKVDFSDKKEVKTIIPKIFNKYNIKIVVNNASIFKPTNFDTAGDDELYNHFDINFGVPYLLTKYFKTQLGTGQIINILDTKIRSNKTEHLDYILSKKLLAEFTKISAKELAPNIRVNGIAPGIILPPPDKDEDYIIKLSQKIPMQTTGNKKLITDALAFLINNRFITGQIIYIDGGEHL